MADTSNEMEVTPQEETNTETKTPQNTDGGTTETADSKAEAESQPAAETPALTSTENTTAPVFAEPNAPAQKKDDETTQQFVPTRQYLDQTVVPILLFGAGSCCKRATIRSD
ncbi:hypothetical protein M3Y94_00218900 [Aphelenchoides besseyi]|nr:hypothetical protein M3Y94_00218900 [Aphelenchoides besseyi]